MTRIVLDTNIFISAIIKSGKPRKILKKGIGGNYSLVISGEILQEIIGVLRRPKFNMAEADVRKIMFGIIESSETISIRSKFKVVKNDPDDDIVVNTAYDGNADYIVSGDSDLLKLKNFKGIRIVTVDEILIILEKDSS
jgi:putative PIN family toxin of toxin-antitoxin system